MIRIKICGIQTLEAARWAIEAGADALGFVFVPHSKRYIPPHDAQVIIKQLPPFVSKVGVFADEPPQKVAEILRECHLDTLQLHGQEDLRLYHPLPIAKIKVLSFPSSPSLITTSPTAMDKVGNADLRQLRAQLQELPPNSLQGILLDSSNQGTRGGTGLPLPWLDTKFQAYLCQVKSLGYPVFLAGGLRPDNVKQALHLTHPYGVDVSSGVEEKGRKDQKKIHHFITQIRHQERSCPYDNCPHDTRYS